MTDEQRTDSLGCYGSAWAHSPNIDRLAGQGVLFRNAITPSPVCVPARTSVLCGKYPSQTGIWHNNPDLKKPFETLMSRFQEAGYITASFGKQHYMGNGSAFEKEVGVVLSSQVHYFRYEKGYDESKYDVVKYPGEIYNWIFGGRFPEDASEKSEWKTVQLGLEWLEHCDHTKPFFLRISFNGPHTPVVPPEPFDRVIDTNKIRFPAASETGSEDQPTWLIKELNKTSTASVLSIEQIRKMRQYYYGEVAFLDSQFGRLLDWMKKRGFLDNTIIVYLSDHGTHLGDHGFVQKQTFYDPVVNVPYIFRYPGKIASGIQIQTPVETQTLLPTLLALTGLGPSGYGYSHSLAHVLLSGKEPDVEPVFSEFTLESFKPYIQHEGRLVMVRLGIWKLSVCVDPDIHDEALYDLSEDPCECKNLANDPTCRKRMDELVALIREHIK